MHIISRPKRYCRTWLGSHFRALPAYIKRGCAALPQFIGPCFVLLLLWSDAPGAAPPSHITLLVVHHSSHQAIVVVPTAVREWSSPSVTVRGGADNWSGLEVHVDSGNERHGIEFPLLFHCMYVVGALCTRRCLHHHHTPLATTRGFLLSHSW